MKDQDTFIDRFFEKTLNQKELEDFQELLETDADFREEVELRMSFRKATAQKETNELPEKNQIKNRLKELQKQMGESKVEEEKPKGKIRNLGRWLTAVAAIGALIIIAYLGFYDARNQSQNLTADFYNNNYTTYEADITLKSIPTNEWIVQLDKVYSDKDFDTAIELANSVLSELPGDAEILMIKGVSLLENKKLEEALTTFNSISNELYADEANWYAAMALIQLNKLDEAKERLKNIKGKKYLEKLENIDLEN